MMDDEKRDLEEPEGYSGKDKCRPPLLWRVRCKRKTSSLFLTSSLFILHRTLQNKGGPILVLSNTSKDAAMAELA
jgi:hypothetical protein